MSATIELFDDPLNPHGWAAQPTFRRLRTTFPDVSWRLRPVVLVPSWDEYEGPELEGGKRGMAATCAQLSERSGMPIDEFLWFSDPPTSSLDACRALAGATDRGETAVRRLSRALREATYIGRTNVSDRDQLRTVVTAALQAADESERESGAEAVLRSLDDGNANEILERHRQAAAGLDLDGVTRVGDRCELPTLVVRGDGDPRGLSGRRRYQAYHDAVVAATDHTPRQTPPDVETVVEQFSAEGWVSTTELAVIVEESYGTVAARAADLVEAGAVVEREFASESFWRLATAVAEGDVDSTGPTAEGERTAEHSDEAAADTSVGGAPETGDE